MIIRILVLLLTLTVVSNGNGCRKDVRLKEVEAEKNIEVEIGEIAEKEYRARSKWKGQLEIDVSKTPEGWQVVVCEIPKVPGAFAMVKISSDKKVTGVIPGN